MSGTQETSTFAERRTHFRVAGGSLAVKCWRIDPHGLLTDRPRPSQRMAVSVFNLSRGGLSVIVPLPCDNLPKIGDRLRFDLPLRRGDDEEVLTIAGRVLYVHPQDGIRCCIGFEFEPALSESLARRRENAFDHILALLQREKIQRTKNSAA